MTFFGTVVTMMLVVPVVAVAAPPEREWPGLKDRYCGAELHLVATDESLVVHYPPREFFSRFESLPINQGEMLREAIPLETLLEAHGAESVRITDCERGTWLFTSRDASSFLLVMTGKGVLKMIREVEDQAPVTLFRFIRVIDFSGPMITR